jgi:NADH dehydrogenase [ubiquinone] 1 alpha subcomplex assembly factor 7
MKDIRQAIESSGSINVAQFMEIAMYNSLNGYYIKSQPIGKNADFITSPEISQLFGEMIGVYCANMWIQLGCPKNFNLVELGPGNGTLMQDLLRAVKNVDGFIAACNIHLVDANHRLIKKQKDLLSSYRVSWHREVSSLPSDLPMIIVANEFFDCLPINQYIKQNNIWYQKCISITPKQEELFFIEMPVLSHFSSSLTHEHPNSKNGSILEICYPAIKLVQQISEFFKHIPGALLIIDYGYCLDPLSRRAYNSTLQAVKNHKFHPIFNDIGRADITAHVDFFSLSQAASVNFAKSLPVITQREFLQNLGINVRAEILKNNQSSRIQEEIEIGLQRLTDPMQMGNLFKVLEINSCKNID